MHFKPLFFFFKSNLRYLISTAQECGSPASSPDRRSSSEQRASFVPEQRRRRHEPALPFHSILAQHPLPAAGGRIRPWGKAQNSSPFPGQPGGPGGDFEPDPERMDLARVPRCWQRGRRVSLPLSLSDGNRPAGLRIAQKCVK